MKKILFNFSLTILLISNINAQNVQNSGAQVKSNEMATSYDRVSLTYVFLNYDEQYSKNFIEIVKNMKVNDKYDDNNISKIPAISIKYKRSSKTLSKDILGSIYQNKLSGKKSTVPRHPELFDDFCKDICKQLGIPKIKK